MKSIASLLLALLSATVCVAAQGGDVNKVLADARGALGGEKKLAALQTLSASGQSVRVANNASLAPTDFEMAFELPDRFMKKDVFQVINGVPLARTSGFNGDQPINVVDQPPPSSGAMFMIRLGPGPAEGAAATPEEQAQQRKKAVLSAKQELARITAGMLLSLPAYPLQFAYAGQAESPDGKADVLNVTGEGDFVARLFIDSSTHLPLMLSWMAKEPLIIQRTIGGPGGKPGMAPSTGEKTVQMKAATPEEAEKLKQQFEEQRKAAEAKLRVVEYRIYYGDYRDVDGVQVPFKLQRSIDGKPTEEVTLEKVKINGKIEAKKFETK